MTNDIIPMFLVNVITCIMSPHLFFCTYSSTHLIFHIVHHMSCRWIAHNANVYCLHLPMLKFYLLTYQHACYIHPESPNFRHFHSTMNSFWVTGQFSEKCTKWPPNDLDMLKVKIPTCMLHTSPRPKFSSVSLYDKPFLSCGLIFGENNHL